jgi:hypothetical protein
MERRGTEPMRRIDQGFCTVNGALRLRTAGGGSLMEPESAAWKKFLESVRANP